MEKLMLVGGTIGLVTMLSCGGESTQEVDENVIADADSNTTSVVAETDTISDESFFNDAKDSAAESK